MWVVYRTWLIGPGTSVGSTGVGGRAWYYVLWVVRAWVVGPGLYECG